MLAVILSWVFAVVATVVILGFCAYELAWKLRRLRTDADRLDLTVRELSQIQVELAGLTQRAAARGQVPQSAAPSEA